MVRSRVPKADEMVPRTLKKNDDGEECEVYTDVRPITSGERTTDAQLSFVIDSMYLKRPTKPKISVVNGMLELEWQKESAEVNDLLDGFEGDVASNIISKK